MGLSIASFLSQLLGFYLFVADVLLCLDPVGTLGGRLIFLNFQCFSTLLFLGYQIGVLSMGFDAGLSVLRYGYNAGLFVLSYGRGFVALVHLEHARRATGKKKPNSPMLHRMS